MSDYRFTYLRPLQEQIQQYVDYCLEVLEKANITDNYSFAFTGNSGALVAPILGYILKKDVIVVRGAPSDHSFYMVEGSATGKFILVDDFVETGKTLEFMLAKIAESRNTSLGDIKEMCLGVILYRDSEATNRFNRHTAQSLEVSGIRYLNFVLKEN